MGEALITRRDNSRDNYEIILLNSTSHLVEGLDFSKYDYICHFTSRIVDQGLVNADIYIIKSGVITEEYHTNGIGRVYVTIKINKSKGTIELDTKYSNVAIEQDGSLIIAMS